MAYIIFLVKSDILRTMLKLQRTELEILRTRASLEKLQLQAEGLMMKLEELKKRREVAVKRAEEVKRDIQSHKELIEECGRKAKVAEERLSLVKRAEEYKALLREKAKHEDCAIKLASSLRSLEEELKRLEGEKEDKKLAKQMEEIQEELADIRYSQSRLKNRLEELEEDLKNLMDVTEDKILQEYENLKRKHGLPLILPVDSLGACTSCGTKLPSALYSRLVGGDVVVCPSCGRFVYYEEPLS
ncbi:MAG: C4-type zinc ribbon domain-containing protein [Aquificaceae bacterium]|nr:C4-type zinc ribbon domain-containing protein [Aquificaceae bacterium]MCX8164721.1 C4-type zinc ribbon domain-containing protein [Aquificaceae bacterium]